MSVNKNIFERLKVYDSCLCGNEGATKEVIMEKLTESAKAEREKNGEGANPNGIVVKDRQFYNDLKTIGEVWKIGIDRKKIGKSYIYKYKQPGFTIFPVPFEDDFLTKIRKGLLPFKQFKGLPNLTFLDPLFELTKGDDHNEPDPIPIVEFDGNPDLAGLGHFPKLLENIQNKRVLIVNYNSSYNKMEEYLFCPYFLKQYNSRWFVLGSKIDYPKSISTLALDRIVAIEDVGGEKYIETTINFDKEYFEDVIGATVIKHVKSVPIILKFSKERFEYVKTKTLHLSQKPVKDKELTICIDVIPNRELESLILYFGADVEVLEPESLRNKIKARIAQSHKMYKQKEDADIEFVI